MGFLGRLFGTRTAAAARRRAAPSHAPLSIEISTISDAGPVRDHNEDRVSAVQFDDPSSGTTTYLFALADGMGGHQAGEVASEFAIDAARSAFLQSVTVDPVRRLADAMRSANAEVHAASMQRRELQGMGTTLVMLALEGSDLCYAWVGDSRLYRLRGGALDRLTEDDTLVEHMLRDGVIKPEDVADHPDRGILSQAIGTREAIADVHVAGPIDALVGDRFLLCSDGLHDVLDDAAIVPILGAGTVADAARALVDAAIALRTEDNVSVCVIGISSAEASTRAPRTTATHTTLPP